MLPVLIVMLVVILVGVVVLARRGAGRASARVEGRLAELDVQQQAKGTFYGFASGGEGQMRRLGNLVLTPDSLVFLQFVPEGEVTIRRADVTGSVATTSFLGKTQDRELLVVSFTSDAAGSPGGGDQAAWELPDIAAWNAALGQ